MPIFRPIALFVAAALIAGCAATDDGQQTQVEGTAIGAGIGALLGCALGAAIIGEGGCLTGAVVGGGAGALAGFGVGTEIADRKQKYANLEDFYDAQIDQTEKLNRELARRNRELEIGIRWSNTEIALLKRDIRQGRATQAQLRAKADAVERERKAAQETLTAAKEELEVKQAVLANAQRTSIGRRTIDQLKAEVEELNEQIAALSNNLVALGQTRSSAI